MTDRELAGDLVFVALVALFMTGILSAQLLAVKILAVGVPFTLPGVGGAIIVPAGVLAYALTYLATDCITELYGRRTAHIVVNVGFGFVVVMLALVWLAILAPGAEVGVDPAVFAQVMAPSTNIIIGGLLAYVISQNWDVFAFHWIREYTGRRWLWVRNIGSTATSQALDTVVFIVVAFLVAPLVLGIGEALPVVVVMGLIMGHYLAKLVIAILDTPLVYLVVGAARSGQPAVSPPAPG